ncbi:MAG: Rpn family recombination-promoting nuclease/putative transposase [Spirochaetota bacterium]|nr:Rpn family recombination-promoting nuclease/putative transposase [Spirochaetota bacterium]
MKIADPHDHFFKTVFTDKENAIDFVKGIFPENIKNTLKIPGNPS